MEVHRDKDSYSALDIANDKFLRDLRSAISIYHEHELVCYGGSRVLLRRMMLDVI